MSQKRQPPYRHDGGGPHTYGVTHENEEPYQLRRVPPLRHPH